MSEIHTVLNDGMIFVNLNLSPMFKEMDFFCRKLKKEGEISSMSTSHANITIKVDNTFHKIFHLKDLSKLFPVENISSCML